MCDKSLLRRFIIVRSDLQKRIRAKLDSTGLGWSIKTIYGVGYKFEVE